MTNRKFAGLLALALVACSLAQQVSAKEPKFQPFKSRVEAVWDNIFNGLFAPPANFVGISQTTHMGRTAQQGTLVLGPPVAPGIFPGEGSVTLTAANGDKLSFDYVGLLNAATGEGAGTFVFTGGTGRFANAKGDGTFYALINTSLPANQPMVVTLDGRINY